MSLVSAKCPNCGASIQVDNERKEAFCSYCGSKVIVQEAVQLVRIDNSGDINNYIEIAKTALESSNGEEAYKYANKVLELDSTNGDAWLIKMKALDFMGTLQDLRISEIITTGKLAMSKSDNTDIKKEVLEFYLQKNIAILNVCNMNMLDYKGIKDLYEANCAVDAFHATENTLAADSLCGLLMQDAESSIQLRRQISNEDVQGLDLTSLVVTLSQVWIEYTSAISTRFNAMGAQVNDEYTEKFRNILTEIKEGLPEEEKAQIKSESIQNPSPSACYIATAVYGSYDAPEVMVLRQFRDEVLLPTFFGRMFVKTYYKLSPPVANRLRNAKKINKFVRNILDKWVDHLQNK